MLWWRVNSSTLGPWELRKKKEYKRQPCFDLDQGVVIGKPRELCTGGGWTEEGCRASLKGRDSHFEITGGMPIRQYRMAVACPDCPCRPRGPVTLSFNSTARKGLRQGRCLTVVATGLMFLILTYSDVHGQTWLVGPLWAAAPVPVDERTD